MEKFKNEKNLAERSFKGIGLRKNSGSFEKLALRLVPTGRPNVLNDKRISNIRNISARINARVAKSRSLLDITDSKENNESKEKPLQQSFERSISYREKGC